MFYRQLEKVQKHQRAHQVSAKQNTQRAGTAKHRSLSGASTQRSKRSSSTNGMKEQTRAIKDANVEAHSPKDWNPEMTRRLRDLVDELGPKWASIAEKIPGKTATACMLHWRVGINPHHMVKGSGTWTAEEDERLSKLVEVVGMKWSDLARHIPGRIAKQCRERYLNHLDPSLRKDMPWTEDEEALLMRLCFAKQNQIQPQLRVDTRQLQHIRRVGHGPSGAPLPPSSGMQSGSLYDTLSATGNAHGNVHGNAYGSAMGRGSGGGTGSGGSSDAASPGSGFAPGGYWHQMVKEETSVPHDSDEDLQEGSCGGSSAGTKLMVVSGVSVAKGRGGVRRVGGERGGGGGGGGGRDGGGVSGVSVEVPPSSCGSAPSSLSSSCLSAAGLPSATAVMDVGGGSGKNGRMLPTSSTACVTVPGCDASVIAADPSPVDGGGIGGRGQTARFPPEGPPLSC
eukprot:jgi/Undpi1/2567/HiC_scaffold_13.g05946.m1